MGEGRIRNFTEDTKAFLLEQVEEKDESWRVQFPQLSGALDAGLTADLLEPWGEMYRFREQIALSNEQDTQSIKSVWERVEEIDRTFGQRFRELQELSETYNKKIQLVADMLQTDENGCCKNLEVTPTAFLGKFKEINEEIEAQKEKYKLKNPTKGKDSSIAIDIMTEQFGFDRRTSDAINQVYQGIQKKYKNLSQKERDWYFARALSQLGDYNNKKVKILFIDIETHAWRKGAGWAYRYDEEEEFFCEKLGLEEKEYKYMRQMIRLQHLISSNDNNNYTYEAVVRLKEKKKETFNIWKEKMGEALGRRLEDSEYLELYKELYQKFGTKGDYSHMLYTVSANLNDDKYNVDNDWHNIGAPSLSWDGKEERKDITGWLGDAVYTGDENKVSFKNDDYIADLDADNIAGRTDGGLNLLSAIEGYYQELQKGGEEEKRTQEFLKNNTYEAVEKAVLERINAKDMNGDKKETIEDLQDDSTYKDTYEFLLRLKKCEKNQGE